ncbi:ArsR/SmtB family transcription factor [Nocardia coffeae]|uniref:ArsR/SmtB family transcription factor n=1 Tax=Nocardia coffeae TaxID=2873381 RepID=UPI001F2DCF4A|nr:metalloregulator ArsR/SmtB family transcription factor [Nocardia coffeae]
MTADSGAPSREGGVPARRSRVAVEAPTPIPHDPFPYRAPLAPAVPTRPVLDSAGELLRALAAPVRIAIVLQLRESPRCVHELVDTLGVTQPLVSQHLRILKSAGVVRGERTGREVIYELVDDHLARIVVDAVAHAEEG